jgi:hypothetical protein
MFNVKPYVGSNRWPMEALKGECARWGKLTDDDLEIAGERGSSSASSRSVTDSPGKGQSSD